MQSSKRVINLRTTWANSTQSNYFSCHKHKNSWLFQGSICKLQPHTWFLQWKHHLFQSNNSGLLYQSDQSMNSWLDQCRRKEAIQQHLHIIQCKKYIRKAYNTRLLIQMIRTNTFTITYQHQIQGLHCSSPTRACWWTL